ncbi:actin [Theileria orientalis]|uniref:Actin n=1 Tax=Theileria orientalis TaxID=68886 RepID=A0A976MA12_THEOR|nr:actin [Theileria orientalis]
MADEQCVVIDNGSSSLKIGLSGSYSPLFIVPSVVANARTKYKDKFSDEYYFLDDFESNLEYMSLTHLIDHGHITDFDKLELLWQHCFNKLELHSDCRPVLLTEAPFSSSSDRVKTSEIFFEKFNVDDLNISVSGLLSMYGLGKLTGTIVEIGDGVTQVIPVIEGYSERASINRVDFGGLELTMYLQKLLCTRGYYLTSRSDFQLVRKLKEKLCFCSLDPHSDEDRLDLEEVYTLPDGTVLRDGETTEIDLSLERFYVCEALFNPNIVDSDAPGIVKTVWKSILSSAMTSRTTLTDNIFVSGGTTLFPNFEKRLQMELQDIAPPGGRNKVKVTAHPDRHTMAWRGGSILSEPKLKDISSNMWISRSEWDENGQEIVLRKFGLDN